MSESNQVTVKIKTPASSAPRELEVARDATCAAFCTAVSAAFPDDPLLGRLDGDRGRALVLVKGRVFRAGMKLSDVPDVSNGAAVYIVEAYDIPPCDEEEDDEPEPKPSSKSKDKSTEPDEPYIPEPAVELADPPTRDAIMGFVFRLQQLLARLGMQTAQLQSNIDGIEIEPATKSYKEYLRFWEKEGAKFTEYRDRVAALRNRYFSAGADDVITPDTEEPQEPAIPGEEERPGAPRESSEAEAPARENAEADESNNSADELATQTCLSEEELRTVARDAEEAAARACPPRFSVDYGLNRTNNLYKFLK